MIEILAAAGGLGTVAMAIGVAVIALRLSGAKQDAADADKERRHANRQYEEAAKELRHYKARTLHQLEGLREDISELENDLAKCTSPGSTKRRIERLFAKATKRPND